MLAAVILFAEHLATGNILHAGAIGSYSAGHVVSKHFFLWLWPAETIVPSPPPPAVSDS